MASDYYGNYVAGLNSAAPVSSMKVGQTLYGDGAPSGTPEAWQALYVDETSGHVYENKAGVWTEVI